MHTSDSNQNLLLKMIIVLLIICRMGRLKCLPIFGSHFVVTVMSKLSK